MTATQRDVARRRRRWILAELVPVVGNVPAVAWVWWRGGLLMGILVAIVWANVCITVWRHGVEYRRGYWTGRSDVHVERAARAAGVEPVSCHGAEPWSPPRDDGELIDEIRSALRRRATSWSNEQQGGGRS